MGFELPLHHSGASAGAGATPPAADAASTLPAGQPARTELWSCIACGAIGTTADLCTGACDDRRATYVRAVEHDAIAAATAAIEAWLADAHELLTRMAAADATGEDGAERAWQGWQADARAVLARRPVAPTGDDTAGVGDDPDAGESLGEVVAMWACATCGRIEAPQPCLGVCIHRPEEFVRADVHRAMTARGVAAAGHAAAAAAVLGRVAHATPRAGGWTASVAAVRAQAAALGG